jgi:signal peptidase
MEPKVPTGSIIYTLKEKIYNKGDIIAFVDNNVAVSHRIVGIKELGSEIYYSTKGDANNMEDEDLVSKEAVYGKIIAVIPFVGKFRK